MKKKIVTLVISIMTLTSILVGCGMEQHIDVGSNGKTDATVYYYYTDEELKSNDINLDNVTYVGKKNYKNTEYSVYESKDNKETDTKEIEDIMTKNGFYYSYQETDSSESDSIIGAINPFIVTVSFPSEITKSNGEIDASGKNVTFDMKKIYDEDEMYAYNEEYCKTKKAELKGLKCTEKLQYVKKKNYKIKGFTEISKVKVNGEDKENIEKVSLKNGKNEVEIENKAGVIKYKLLVDNQDPTVKGIKDKGTYKSKVVIKASDKYSGIKEASIDGKKITVSKIKKGYTVKGKGSHIFYIKDKAENSKVINFVIK